MNIWNRARSVLRKWRRPEVTITSPAVEQHLLQAHRNIRDLIEDQTVPAAVRNELADEFREIEAISGKLRNGEIHIAAFGRVGVGKSSLLNALLGCTVFATSPLHGHTRRDQRADWEKLAPLDQAAADEFAAGHVVLIDTPGLDELDGDERERVARRVARQADVALVLCEGDLTGSEHQALQQLCAVQRAVLVVLNKADRYTAEELQMLLGRLRERCDGLVPPGRVITASADPRPEVVIRTGRGGREVEQLRERPPDVAQLRQQLWTLLEQEGRSLAALNAAIFAGELDEKIASRIVAARRNVADSIIRKYCLGKGLLVALNPVPVADLLTAAGSDVAMIVHLGEVYGFRLSRREASGLLVTISAQFAALMGAYWGMNLASSALKGASAGLSTALTATSQGALAWYATRLTGNMAQTWFSRGKSWGGNGPKETARSILASLDRDALMREARDDLAARLGRQ